MGKLQTAALVDLLKCIKRTSKVIIPPTPGLDSGVHELGDGKYIVVSTDPCIGVPKEWFGWLLIHYASSDVAVFGAEPQYCAINLLAPPKTPNAVFGGIMKQACEAADELGISIVTGHTGTYNGLSELVGTCTVYGVIERDSLITPAGARPGDCLVCTKPLGFETLVNFAQTQKALAAELFGHRRALELARGVKAQTCVNEALLLARTVGVTAMHDATEGGFLAALIEMADASNMGFSVDSALLPILPELKMLANHFHLTQGQVLATSSTGTLLASVSRGHGKKVVEALSGIRLNAKIVGTFTKSKKRVLKLDGQETEFPRKANDPYARIMKGRARFKTLKKPLVR